jgi:hypothetical protein
MTSRRLILLPVAVAAGGIVGIGAPEALAGSGQAPGGQQTHPYVTPRVGGRHSKFKLSFTLAQAPGRASMDESSYRVEISAPAHARESCSPPQPAPIVTGSQGEVERIAPHPPRRGWCTGQYDVTVYLQQTHTCGPPAAMTSRHLCPVSSSEGEPGQTEEVNTGETYFKVR